MGIDDNNEPKETLHIKKHGSAGGELRYYSSHKERLSLPSASRLYVKTPKKKRRRTSSIIIILDIVIIVIAFILFRLFLFEPADQATLAGYRFSLRQIVSENAVVVSITVRNVSQNGVKPGSQARVVFSLQPEDSTRTAVIDLPESSDGSRIIRVSLPLTSQTKTIRAEITLGKESAELSLHIKKSN
jgi:flagellar basal body-associated protein FliL